MRASTNVHTRTRFAVVAVFAALVVVAYWPTASAQSSTDLGTADPFAILAGSAVTNTGPSTINGDIGVHPGSSVTGFEAATVNGEIHIANAVAEQAKADLTNAYNEAAGQSPATSLTTQLGNQVLTPGVYDSASGTFGLTGELTLDAQNDPDAVWIFQMESTIITASHSSVVLVNGAQACNVFWQVGSSATLGSGNMVLGDATGFKGNILAQTSITLGTGARLDGRALAITGAVTLDNNVITIAECEDPPVEDPPADDPPADDPPADDPPADDPPGDDPPADDPPGDDPPADDPPTDDPPGDDPPADDPPAEETPDVCATDLTASANSDSSITLTWASVEGAQEYRIYRAVGGGALVLHDEVEGDATGFTDTDTDVGSTYRYEIRPVAAGVESQDCDAVEVTAIPVFPSVVAGALVIGFSLAGYVALRRRR